MIRPGILLLALTGASLAQEAPETSAEPVQRPETVEAASDTDAVEAPSAPETPEAESAAQGDAAPTASEPEAYSERERIASVDEVHRLCLAALDALGAEYRVVDPILPEGDPDCGILRPLEVVRLTPDVALEPAATLRCPTAVALAEWMRDFVAPAADRLGRGAVTALRGGSGYTCRRRNNQPTGQLSQHAFGNAFDVTSFTFAVGDPLAIMPRARDGSMEESFQDAVRASACLEFTTVLGPGSDDFHDDHLHLDVKARDGGFRLCEQGMGEGG